MPAALAIVPVTPFQQNCTILMCQETHEAAIVDPGGDLERIEQALQKMQAKPVAIWLTHAHVDHAGGTADLAEKLGIPITGPQKEDQFWIELLPKQSAAYGFTPARTFTPDRWLEDGDTVTVGKVTLRVIHTPGHTPGHVVFYQPEQKFALVGDVIFNGSIGRTDFPRGNHQQLIDSIRGKLFPLGDEVEFVCGHGPNSTFGRERQTNPFVADHRG